MEAQGKPRPLRLTKKQIRVSALGRLYRLCRAILRMIRGSSLNVVGGALDYLRYGQSLPAIGRPVMIDPRLIVGEVRDTEVANARPETRGISRVRGGDWDTDPKPIPHWVSLYINYFESRMDDSAREILYDELAARGRSHRAKSDIARCDDLLASISRHGFRWEMGDPRVRRLPLALRRWVPRGVSGLQVAIARDGSYLKAASGTHRLAVALHLEMSEVPAQICLAHEEWVIAQTRAPRARKG